MLGLGCSGRGCIRYYLRVLRSRSATAIVLGLGCSGGDALAISLGFFVPEVLLRSCWVWDVQEGDALATSFVIRSDPK